MLDQLNEMQREAVTYGDGPLLILAGAGSGKTRALTHRIAYLIHERGVDPRSILAITFTNKAAGEMRERVAALLGAGAVEVWVATFHATCARILRREADLVGRTSDFAIYDTGDQRQMVRDILTGFGWDAKRFPPPAFLRAISDAKNEMCGPEEYGRRAAGRPGDAWAERVARVYRAYQRRLEENNAFDFDDLILRVVETFEGHDEVLARYQSRFRHILVDEYQDTNHAQYRLVRALAAAHRNLTVVGDDDQSIYAFRGADTRNILEFEREYPDAHVVKLEQNYRSTVTVLEAANNLVRHNRLRKGKRLWTGNDQGDRIRYYQATDQRDEAAYVGYSLNARRAAGELLGGCVVLYRTNAQSRPLEEALMHLGLPYQIVGSVRFYERQEIKDLLAYMRLVANPADAVSLQRIINVPRRGAGPATWAKVAERAAAEGLPVVEAMGRLAAAGVGGGVGGGGSGGSGGLTRSCRAALGELAELLRELGAARDRVGPDQVLAALLERTGYEAELVADGTPEARARLENLDELRRLAAEFARAAPELGLRGFLDQMALVSDADTLTEAEDRVVLMTVHTAKGLEFDHVYLVGLDEGLFPHQRSLESGNDLEEERRLCYVALTRAKVGLHLSSSASRIGFGGEREPMRPSRFLGELPRELIEVVGRDGAPERQELYRSMTADGGRGRRPLGRGGVTVRWRDAAAAGELAARQRGLAAGALGGGGGGKVAMPGPAPAPAVVDAADLPRPADRVRHPRWGEGVVIAVKGDGEPAEAEITVAFPDLGIKRLIAGYARLEKLD